MNFLQLLASGASILNFNFQSKSPISTQASLKNTGFQKVSDNNIKVDQYPQLSVNDPQTKNNILVKMLQNERSQLISRYLQLNFQLLNGQSAQNELNKLVKLTQQGKIDSLMDKQENDQKQASMHNNLHKKKMYQKLIICYFFSKKQIKCGHSQKQHYAKGLCSNCYHKFGRNKKPMKCPHDKLYAGGMCQNCYINQYNKKKREQLKNNQLNGNYNQINCESLEIIEIGFDAKDMQIDEQRKEQKQNLANGQAGIQKL